LAYHEKGQIWESNELYDRFFSERTTAKHVLFAFSLLRATEQARQEAGQKPESDRTEAEKRLVQFFRQRGSNFPVLVVAVADSVETILGRQVPDPFSLHLRVGSIVEIGPTLSALQSIRFRCLAEPHGEQGECTEWSCMSVSARIMSSRAGASGVWPRSIVATGGRCARR
jgi:hypothetical protein